MITASAFLALAGLGAVARAVIGSRLNPGDGFPVGTLVVNVSGSFALGLLHATAPPLLTVLGTGGLGAYTTFSSFARDVVALVEGRRYAAAAAYGATSCVAAVAAAWAAILLVD